MTLTERLGEIREPKEIKSKAAAAAAMHRTPKQTAITPGASIPPAFLICPLNPVR